MFIPICVSDAAKEVLYSKIWARFTLRHLLISSGVQEEKLCRLTFGSHSPDGPIKGKCILHGNGITKSNMKSKVHNAISHIAMQQGVKNSSAAPQYCSNSAWLYPSSPQRSPTKEVVRILLGSFATVSSTTEVSPLLTIRFSLRKEIEGI